MSDRFAKNASNQLVPMCIATLIRADHLCAATCLLCAGAKRYCIMNLDRRLGGRLRARFLWMTSKI